MRQVSKQTLLWIGVGVAAIFLFDRLLKKRQSKNPENTGGGSLPIPNPQNAIGRTAFAISDSTKVRSSARVNNGTINNIVGILKKDEAAGIIKKVEKGTDGKDWYFVSKSIGTYNCPFEQCGFTGSHSYGYVRSDVVKVS